MVCGGDGVVRQLLGFMRWLLGGSYVSVRGVAGEIAVGAGERSYCGAGRCVALGFSQDKG